MSNSFWLDAHQLWLRFHVNSTQLHHTQLQPTKLQQVNSANIDIWLIKTPKLFTINSILFCSVYSIHSFSSSILMQSIPKQLNLGPALKSLIGCNALRFSYMFFKSNDSLNKIRLLIEHQTKECFAIFFDDKVPFTFAFICSNWFIVQFFFAFMDLMHSCWKMKNAMFSSISSRKIFIKMHSSGQQ